jgi:hypothetical protein
LTRIYEASVVFHNGADGGAIDINAPRRNHEESGRQYQEKRDC